MTPSRAAHRLHRRTFPVMGTMVSISSADQRIDDMTQVALEVLQQADTIFSTYRSDSELSRLRRRDPTILMGPEMREVLTDCRALHLRTEGAFRPMDDAGRIDPTGYVKGWAMARVEQALRSAGCTDWLLIVGGDVVAAGRRADRPWGVAVRHPTAPGAVAEVLPVSDGAVATSGDYERGGHVWGRHRGPRAGSVTVTGPRIEVADALATALWSCDERSPQWWAHFPGYHALWLDGLGHPYAA